jgi:hypothetical protein
VEKLNLAPNLASIDVNIRFFRDFAGAEIALLHPLSLQAPAFYR